MHADRCPYDRAVRMIAPLESELRDVLPANDEKRDCDETAEHVADADGDDVVLHRAAIRKCIHEHTADEQQSESYGRPEERRKLCALWRPVEIGGLQIEPGAEQHREHGAFDGQHADVAPPEERAAVRGRRRKPGYIQDARAHGVASSRSRSMSTSTCSRAGQNQKISTMPLRQSPIVNHHAKKIAPHNAIVAAIAR